MGSRNKPLGSGGGDVLRADDLADAQDAVDRCVRVRDRIEPEWDYEELYQGFRRLYPTLKELR